MRTSLQKGLALMYYYIVVESKIKMFWLKRNWLACRQLNVGFEVDAYFLLLVTLKQVKLNIKNKLSRMNMAELLDYTVLLATAIYIYTW